MKLIDARAKCNTCGKIWTSLNAHGVGARHAHLYNHEVIVEVSYGRVYNSSHTNKPEATISQQHSGA